MPAKLQISEEQVLCLQKVLLLERYTSFLLLDFGVAAAAAAAAVHHGSLLICPTSLTFELWGREEYGKNVSKMLSAFFNKKII